MQRSIYAQKHERHHRHTTVTNHACSNNCESTSAPIDIIIVNQHGIIFLPVNIYHSLLLITGVCSTLTLLSAMVVLTENSTRMMVNVEEQLRRRGFTVLTQNLWYQNNRKLDWRNVDEPKIGAWRERCLAFKKWVAFLEPDVICLQEILKGPECDMLEDIFAGNSLYKFREFYHASPFWGDAQGKTSFGNAIVSKFPIQNTFHLDLPVELSPGSPFHETRSALNCIVKVPLIGDVSVTCTHLNYKLHHSEIRLKQTVALTGFVEKHRPHGKDAFPAIICGDFNAKPDEASIRYLRGLQPVDLSKFGTGAEHERPSVFFEDAWSRASRSRNDTNDTSGHTWVSYNSNTVIDLEENKRLDYIFATPCKPNGFGAIEECMVVCNHPFASPHGEFPSDHFGVFASFRVTPKMAVPNAHL